MTQVFVWHLQNIFNWLKLILHRRSSTSTRGIIFFPQLKAFRVNLVFSVLAFIVFVLHFTDHISKRINRASTRTEIHTTFWDLIYSKNWYLLNAIFFSLKKKLEHGRIADELFEVISKCMRNEVKSWSPFSSHWNQIVQCPQNIINQTYVRW